MTTQAGHSSRIFSAPTGATIRINGRLLGTTTSSGLLVLWQLGVGVTIEKPGFQTATLVFSYPSEKREITIELTRAARESKFPNRVVPRARVEQAVHEPARSEPPKISPDPSKGKHFRLRLVGLITLLPLLLGFLRRSVQVFHNSPRHCEPSSFVVSRTFESGTFLCSSAVDERLLARAISSWNLIKKLTTSLR